MRKRDSSTIWIILRDILIVLGPILILFPLWLVIINSFKSLEEAGRNFYALPDGLKLEVSHVDKGLPTEFWYAEVEYETVEAAEKWDPASAGLENYLNDEVTGLPGQSMGAYWEKTRMGLE